MATHRIRNHVARSALLRKGGAHQKSRSASRQSAKRKLDDLVFEYFEERGAVTKGDRSSLWGMLKSVSVRSFISELHPKGYLITHMSKL